jgi:hypothetical protein
LEHLKIFFNGLIPEPGVKKSLDPDFFGPPVQTTVIWIRIQQYFWVGGQGDNNTMRKENRNKKQGNSERMQGNRAGPQKKRQEAGHQKRIRIQIQLVLVNKNHYY